jgi:hypothetical protein
MYEATTDKPIPVANRKGIVANASALVKNTVVGNASVR